MKNPNEIKIFLPGISSVLVSLYLIPKEYAEEDSWTVFSAFCISYDPGAEMK